MKNLDCDLIARDIWLFCQERNFWIMAVHIPGIENIEADPESRIKPNLEWELPHDIFEKINRELGYFDIDLFTSRLKHKIERYCSWLPDPFAEEINAFSFSWSKLKFYAFPPFSVILKAVRKASNEGARGVMVTPMWRAQPWFPRLQKLATMPILGKVPLNNPITNEEWQVDLVALVISKNTLW